MRGREDSRSWTCMCCSTWNLENEGLVSVRGSPRAVRDGWRFRVLVLRGCKIESSVVFDCNENSEGAKSVCSWLTLCECGVRVGRVSVFADSLSE